MSIMKMAVELLGSQLGNIDGNNELLQSVIGNLLGGSGEQNIDLGTLLGNLQHGGMADLAKSWLADGDNTPISAAQIESLFGSEKIQQAASQLGADRNELVAGLQNMIPQIIDKSSNGGNLLDMVGGVGGLTGLASKFLK